MGRIFTLLLLVTVLLVLAIGGTVRWISSVAIINSKEQAAAEVATSIALSISEQTRLLNKALDRIANQTEVVTAATSANPILLESTAENINKYFPQAMRVRLLLPGINKIDETAVPHMGYADLDMVRETFIKPQAPIVQGDKGNNRHLAMTSQITQNNKIVGVVLASLNPDFFTRTVKATELRGRYVELRQDTLVLGTSGEALDKKQAREGEIEVPHTTWKLYYQYDADTSLGEKTKLWSSMAGAVLIAFTVFFWGYRRLSKLLKNDLNSVLNVFKDIITHKSLGSYPVNLTEMNIVISSFLRLHRAMGDITDNLSSDKVDDLEKFGFFSKAEDHFELSDVASDRELFNEKSSEQSSEKEVPVNKTPEIAAAKIGVPRQHEGPAHVDDKVKSTKTPVIAKSSETSKSSEISKKAVVVKKDDVASVVFKAYDIRGVVGTTLTMNLVYDIGRAFGTQAKQHGANTVVIGRDARASSPALSEELAKGIASTGCAVVDIGMVPTPVLYFAVQHIEGRSGVMVTGSHNPSDYNGFKMVIDGETLANERIQDIKTCIDNRSYETGDMGLIEKNPKLTNEYIGTIAEDIRIARPMLIVLDSGNGVGGKLGPNLLKTLGCEVIELHCDIDGNYPNHPPDPSKPENMTDLITAVKHYKADLGLAFDGDADRLGVVDSNGKIIWPDRQMMVFAKNILAKKPGAEIIYDVKCSKHLEAQIKKYGGRPILWKSGHSLMKAKIKESGAKLAGEMSGHIFFNDRWFGFDDALYASARLIEILSNEMHSSAQVFAGFPDSVNTPELNVDLAEADRINFMENLRAAIDFPDTKIIDIDGLRVEFSDGWGLVRLSNTTSSLSFRFEADSLDAMARIQQNFKQLINKVKPDLLLPF